MTQFDSMTSEAGWALLEPKPVKVDHFEVVLTRHAGGTESAAVLVNGNEEFASSGSNALPAAMFYISGRSSSCQHKPFCGVPCEARTQMPMTFSITHGKA